MENDDTTKNQGDTPSHLLPVTVKKQTRKERSKANEASQKSTKQQKHTLWRNWKSLSRTKQLELIFLGLVAIGGIGYLGVTIWGNLLSKWHFEAEHRPIVIHSRQPKLLQTVSCEPTTGFNVGNLDIFVKNIGNGTADNVFASWDQMKVVPEQKLGDPFWDDPPSITPETCSLNATPEPKYTFPLAHGEEKVAQMKDAVGAVPPVSKGAKVQFYMATCVFYSDGDRHHGTCDTYRLFVPSDEPLEKLLGTPTIVCDGRNVTGTFVDAFAGHCQN